MNNNKYFLNAIICLFLFPLAVLPDIVNNQIGNYPNKNLCGAGVVYKFLQAVSDTEWTNSPDKYLDLVALGNISDCMDIREPETKRLVEKGLNKIQNKMFRALIKSQEYSLKGSISMVNIQFSITPLINAIIRVGEMDEKNILFRGFLERDELFKYKKRGSDEEIDENIYERASRLAKNAVR